VAKTEQEFYKPADACRLAEVAPYVLRYWETEFPALAEGKEKGAAKLYSSRDVKIIARIRELLYDEGFTVAGAKKRLEAEITEGRFEDGLKAAPPPAEQKLPARAVASMRTGPIEPELAEPAFLSESAAPAKATPAVLPAAFPERKRVVKELKEIVKILDRGKTR
jgi:DNA-binding transcriptional MerR regulator